MANDNEETSPSDITWCCDCGSTSFFLRQDGEAECTQCQVIQSGSPSKWISFTLNKTVQDSPADVSVQRTNCGLHDFSYEFIKRRAFSKDNKYIIVIDHDGCIHHHGSPDNVDDAEYLKKRLAVASKAMTPK